MESLENQDRMIENRAILARLERERTKKLSKINLKYIVEIKEAESDDEDDGLTIPDFRTVINS